MSRLHGLARRPLRALGLVLAASVALSVSPAVPASAASAVGAVGAVGAAGAASAAPGAAVASAAVTRATLAPSSGALLGQWIRKRDEATWYAPFEQRQEQVGRRFDLHRTYDSWSDAQPSGMVQEDVARGITPMLSIFPGEFDRTVPVRWADIASGAHDAAILRQADGLKSLGVPLYLTLHHEPEDDGPTHGTPAEYVAAWRHYVDLFRARGATNVAFNWVLMTWTFSNGSAASWYPGDDYVDFVGGDGYNWHACQDQPWREAKDIFKAFRAFGQAHGKPLTVAEFGSRVDPADPAHLGQWMANTAETFASWPEIKAVAYFEAGMSWAPGECQWWLDTALPAWKAFGQHPHFNVRPQVALTASAARGPAGVPLGFSTAGTTDVRGALTSWEFTPGDGTPARSGTGAPPAALTHTYDVGQFTATLRVTNSAGQADFAVARVTGLPAPRATTGGPDDVTPAGATVTGWVNASGLPTTWCVEYGTTTAYGRRTPEAALDGTNALTTVSTALADLAADETYHYRVVATNAAGTTLGADRTFTTAGTPAVGEAWVTSVGTSSADVRSMVDANLLATTSRVEYGTTAALGSSTAPLPTGDNGWSTPVTGTMTGLTADTTYWWRVVATNSAGSTYGATRTLTTAGAPALTGARVSDVLAAGATVRALVDPNQLATTTWAEYGTTPALGSRTAATPAGDKGYASGVAAALTGLRPGTTYSYRTVAANSAGTTYGPVQSFTTLGAPTVGTVWVADLTATSAGVRAMVDADQQETRVVVEYGLTPALGSRTAPVPAGSKGYAVTVAAELAGLAKGTTYSYRVVATNGSGTTYGPVRSVTTRRS